MSVITILKRKTPWRAEALPSGHLFKKWNARRSQGRLRTAANHQDRLVQLHVELCARRRWADRCPRRRRGTTESRPQARATFRRPTLLLGSGQLGRRGLQRFHGLAVRTALGHGTSTLSTRSSCSRPSCSRALLAHDTAKKFEESPSAPQIEPRAHLQRRAAAS